MSPDDRIIFSASEAIRVRDSTGISRVFEPPRDCLAMTMAPGNTVYALVVDSETCHIIQYNIAGESLQTFPPSKGMYRLAVSRDGKYVFGAGWDVRVYDAKTARLITVLKPPAPSRFTHTGHFKNRWTPTALSATAVCVSPDGRSLYVAALESDHRKITPCPYGLVDSPYGQENLSTIKFWIH